MVIEALRALDAAALTQAECYFGGGTRIALALGEYRESADVDFLCASRAGYRMLRGAVTQNSLGPIATRHVRLAREVTADRYGIRTFLEMNGEKLKFEIVLEGRIALSGGMERGLPVAALDAASCFAEKFLANCDRWSDASVLGRAARRAATRMIEQAAWRRRCVAGLAVSDSKTLLAGLRLIVARSKRRVDA